MSNIQNIILDFDGTVTDTEKEAVPFLKEWEKLFSERTGLPKKEFLGLAKKIEKEVLNDPKSGWICNDIVVAPATADPYVFTSTVYNKVVEELRENFPEKVPDKKSQDKFMQELFSESYKRAGTSFRKGAKKFLDNMIKKYEEVVIVTNSKTDSVTKKLEKLGDYSDVLVLGNAKKYAVDNSSNSIPESIQPNGFPRPVFLRRMQYKKVLKELKVNARFKPENTAVVGDIYELDLALPEHLGYRTILLETSGTPKYEKEYLRKKTNSFLAKDYDAVIDILSK